MLDFKEIFENFDEPIAIVDKEENIQFVNRSFSSLFNDVSTGTPISNFLNPEKETILVKDIQYRIKAQKKDDYKIIMLNSNSYNPEETYSDFISTVSHELRTPLTSIRGFADTMLMSFEKLDSEQIKKFLKIIKEQSNRLIKLIENLLSISKMQSDKENFIYKTVDVKKHIEKALILIKNQYPNHFFRLNIKENILPVLADENKFQQIIINILENAAKYSNEGTEILIEASDSDKPNYININITDKGTGISKEDAEKIFDKFSRIESHLTSKTQGSGLGLFIVKNLVEKMDGSISVESNIGEGSTFTIKLPCAGYTAQSNKKILEAY